MKRFVIFTLLIASMAHARQIRIITPYIGTIENKLAVKNMNDLKDSAPLGGLYFQWITRNYQWNVFLYQSNNINYSDVFGMHFIFDYYLFQCPMGGKFVLGAGLDYIQIDTDGEVSPFLSNFTMMNRVYAPYVRGGRFFNFSTIPIKSSILLWCGFEKDLIRGNMDFLSLMPYGMSPIDVSEEIKSDYTYLLLGLNVKTQIYHFFEITAKYYRKFSLDDNKDLNTISVLCNLYLNRHWGLSYQFKTMEVSVSNNTYHMGGVAFIF